MAGSMFWIRFSALHPRELATAFPFLNFDSDYVVNLGVQHALERLFTTEIHMRKKKIAQIAPAPHPVAMYFPQYHAIPENDHNWGEGFKEWTLLKPMTLNNMRKPLPVSRL